MTNIARRLKNNPSIYKLFQLLFQAQYLKIRKRNKKNRLCYNIKIYTKGNTLQTVVKKWFREKEYGYLDNGTGPDIMVRKADLIKCQYLKTGTIVEFECHTNKKNLIAKKVCILNQNRQKNHNAGPRSAKPHHFGVMT